MKMFRVSIAVILAAVSLASEADNATTSPLAEAEHARDAALELANQTLHSVMHMTQESSHLAANKDQVNQEVAAIEAAVPNTTQQLARQRQHLMLEHQSARKQAVRAEVDTAKNAANAYKAAARVLETQRRRAGLPESVYEGGYDHDEGLSEGWHDRAEDYGDEAENHIEAFFNVVEGKIEIHMAQQRAQHEQQQRAQHEQQDHREEGNLTQHEDQVQQDDHQADRKDDHQDNHQGNHSHDRQDNHQDLSAQTPGAATAAPAVAPTEAPAAATAAVVVTQAPVATTAAPTAPPTTQAPTTHTTTWWLLAYNPVEMPATVKASSTNLSESPFRQASPMLLMFALLAGIAMSAIAVGRRQRRPNSASEPLLTEDAAMP